MKTTHVALVAALAITPSALFAQGLVLTNAEMTSALTREYYSQEPEGNNQASPSDVMNAPAPDYANGDTSGQKGCGKGHGGKGKGCNCYLFGPDEAISLVGDVHGVTVGGWTQYGYHDSPNTLFNDSPDRLNLHQQWLYVEKALDPSCGCWDWGFRMDVVYGIDAQNTQAFGSTNNGWDNNWDRGNYGWAIPQLYFEVGNGTTSVKFGHFFTIVGYEVVTAPGNFFYSHAYTMNNTEPFTHTGVLVTHECSDRLTVFGGWTQGWDTGFDVDDGGNAFLGGASIAVNDSITVTSISSVGDFGQIGEDGWMRSLVIDIAVTDNLNYVLQNDYKRINSTQDDDIGVNQYLIYSVNDCLALGTRMEWWKDEGQSLYSATWGVNYKPHANITIRPEVRHDWANSPHASLPGGTSNTALGSDIILTF